MTEHVGCTEEIRRATEFYLENLKGRDHFGNMFEYTRMNLIFVGPCIITQLIKTTNVMQHGAFVFIMPVITLYIFRVLFAPIIRSV